MAAERFDPTSERAAVAVRVRRVSGDLTGQHDVDALVNTWNRNYMPRWLLYPGGVSRALKRHTGPAPWKQLARAGVLPMGGCVVTDAGELSTHQKLIHVAGLNLLWRATEASIQTSVHSALRAASTHRMQRIAMPLIGSGSGGFDRASSLRCIEDTLHRYEVGEPLEVLIVEHDEQH